MRTNAGQREIEFADHVADGRGVGIETERSGETVFRSKRGAVVVVGQVGVVEAHLANQLELPMHGRERLHQCETSDDHGAASWW